MMDERKARVSYVIGPDGSPLTLSDLPPASTRRWVIRRKAEVVAAVAGEFAVDEQDPAVAQWDEVSFGIPRRFGRMHQERIFFQPLGRTRGRRGERAENQGRNQERLAEHAATSRNQ